MIKWTVDVLREAEVHGHSGLGLDVQLDSRHSTLTIRRMSARRIYLKEITPSHISSYGSTMSYIRTVLANSRYLHMEKTPIR